MGFLDELNRIDAQKAAAPVVPMRSFAEQLDEVDALNDQIHANRNLIAKYPTLASEYGESLAEQKRLHDDLTALETAEAEKKSRGQSVLQSLIDLQPENALENAKSAYLNIAPEALRVGAQVAQLATGGAVGSDLEKFIGQVQQDINKENDSTKLALQRQLLENPARPLDAVLQNPGGAVAVGAPSIAVTAPVGVGAGTLAGRAALRAGLNTARAGEVAGSAANWANVGLNAAQKFSEQNQEGMNPLQNYLGTAAGALVNRGLGRLTEGGAEGMMARALVNGGVNRGSGVLPLARSIGTGALYGGADEVGDNLSIEIGKAISEGRTPDIPGTVKDSALDAFMGALFGGAAKSAPRAPEPVRLNYAPRTRGDISEAINSVFGSRQSDLPAQPAVDGLQKQDTPSLPQVPVASEQEQKAIANNVVSAIENLAQQNQEQPQPGVQPPESANQEQKPESVADSVNDTAAMILKPNIQQNGEEESVILQNRNRANPASISQMNAIAAHPDYARVSYSRDFGNGAPVVAYGNVPEAQLGTEDIAVRSDGEKIPVRYAVVDANSVLTSNDVTGSVNKNYGSAPASQMRAIAGNGRVAGLTAAYRKGTAAQYREDMKADQRLHGISPQVIDTIKNPILVRIMPADKMRADIGDVSNTSGNLSLNAVETAANDVNRIKFETIQFKEDGNPDDESVKGFVRLMPQGEQGALIDTNGQPSREAYERFNNALFKRAYGDDELVRLNAQAVDPEIRNVLASLARVAPKMARLEGLGDLDIRDLVTQAAQMAVNARREGVALSKYIRQLDTEFDPDAAVFAEVFAKNSRSVKEIARILELAADFAYSEGTKESVDMFGEVPRATRQEVLDLTRRETNGQAAETGNANQADRQDIPAGTQNLAESPGVEPVAQNDKRGADRASVDAGRSGNIEPAQEEKELTLAGETDAKAQANSQRADDSAPDEIAESGQQGLMFSRSAQNWQPDNELIEKAVENFGLTNDIREAFYVLPDGRMLDGSGRHWGGDERSVAGQRQVDHSDISEVIDDASGAEAMYEWMGRTGAMRFDNVVGIASVARHPTKAQLDVLNRANRGKYLALSLNTPEGRIVDDVEFDRASPAKINEFFDQALEKAARGVAGAFASVRLGDRAKSESVQTLRHTLSEDKQIGDSFRTLSDSGVVEIVESVSDLPKNIQKIISTSSSELKSDLTDMKAVKAETLARMRKVLENLGNNEVEVRSDGTRVLISYNGVKHSVNYRGQDWRDALAVLHIHDLVRESIFEDKQTDRNDRRSVVSISHYSAKINIDGTVYPVRIVIRTTTDGVNRFYNVGVDRKNPEATREGRAHPESVPTPFPSSGDVSSVAEGDAQIKRSEAGDIQGVYDPATGKSYLIASNLTKETAKGVFLHEVGVHMAADSAFWDQVAPLIRRAVQIVFNGNSNGDPTAKAVYKRMKDAGVIGENGLIVDGLQEEALAYLVETVANNPSKVSHPIREWFNNLLGAIRRWLYRHGFANVDALTDKDLATMVADNVKLLAQAKTDTSGKIKFSKKANSSDNEIPVSETLNNRLDNGNPVWGYPKTDDRLVGTDTLGNKYFGVGKWVFDHAAAATHFLFNEVDRLSGHSFNLNPLKPEYRKMFRAYKAGIDKAVRNVQSLATAMSQMPLAERRLVSDVVEKMVAPGVNPPEYVVQVAAAISNLMDSQTDEMLRLGLLSQESAERWRGEYLPRVYLLQSRIFDDAKKEFENIFRRGTSAKGIAGQHFKGRGRWRTVVGQESIAQHKQLGWEIRDPNWSDKQGELEFAGEGQQPKVPTVVMWRDFTPQERIEMGEERDAMARLVLGYMQTQQDIALARFFKSISEDTRFASTFAQEDWVKVPSVTIGDNSPVKRYGALAGMWVHPDVWSQMKQYNYDDSAFKRWWRTTLRAWKEGKTALNPVAHMNNVVGNVAMAHFAGVNAWDVPTYYKAIQSIYRNDASYKEAQEAGLFSGSWSREEMINLIPEDGIRDKLTGPKNGYEKFVDLFLNVGSLGTREALRFAYENEDAVFKYVIYRFARARNMAPADAVDYANQFIFTYDDLPSGAQAIRDTALPFFSWTYKAIPVLLRTAMLYPHRFFAPAASVFLMNKLAYLALVMGSSGDDDDWMALWQKASNLEDAEREALPEQGKGNSIFLTPKFMRLWSNQDGTANFLDISRLLPGGDLMDVNNQMGGIPWIQPLMPNSPHLGLFLALFANKDAFTGRQIVKETDKNSEAFRKRLGYVYRNIAPALAPGGYHCNRLVNAMAAATGTTFTVEPFFDVTGTDWQGRQQDLGKALAHTLGVKVKPIDFEQEIRDRNWDMRGEVKHLRGQIKSKAKANAKGSITDEAYESFKKRTIEDIQERVKKIQEFNKKVDLLKK